MDLRFKIIAEHVQKGWDQAKGSVADLKNRFRDFFGGVKGGFGMMAGVVAAVAVAMYKAFEGIRQKWVEEINTMTSASRDFAEQTRDNLRRIRFQDTEQEKSRNIDSIRDQISRKRQELEAAELADSTQSLAGKGVDWWEGKIRGAMGFENIDAEAEKRKRLSQEIFFLEKQLAAASNKGTKDAADAVAKAEDDKKKAAEDRRARDRARHEQELAWIAEEKKAAEAKAEAEKKAFDDAAKEAERLAEMRAHTADLANRIQDAQRAAAYEAASPEQRAKMDAARLRQLGAEYYARDGLGQFTANEDRRAEIALEAIGIKSSMAKAEADAKATAAAEREAQEKARRAAAGQSLSIGDLFTRKYGQQISQDPAERTARASEEQVKLLRSIEQKTGAAP